ncbi:MAG: ZIP family zinc transporter [Verrucomicrobiales bacterium]|jgi:ZIP family zinc transporter
MFHWFEQAHPVVQALLASLFTWGVTALGAATVFLVKEIRRWFLDAMLGFAAGVMIAASFWSLLAPAIEMADSRGGSPWAAPLIGFLLGAGFLFASDKVLPHLHVNLRPEKTEGLKTHWQRTRLLVLAITLHNIPEGLAVGVAFGAVSHGLPEATLPGAIALAMGIGLQNFPEGVAVAMPLRGEGVSRFRSFWCGQLSAAVEPVAAVIGAAAVVQAEPLLPYALAFAAGAMIYVVVEEVIPESQSGGNSDLATMATIIGFAVMMVLDVALS